MAFQLIKRCNLCNIKDTLNMESIMEQVICNGKMEISIQVIGSKVKEMDMELSYIKIQVMFMKGNLKQINLMVKAFYVLIPANLNL